jgi:DMSO/TMAO reductase YedYZ heme-binding membrane subunit
VAFLMGVTALCIFAFMAVISMKVFIVKLGGKLWRELLRYLGFTALLLVLIHFFIKDFAKWISPQTWGNGLPPSSVYIFLMGAFVLSLRMLLALILMRKKS